VAVTPPPYPALSLHGGKDGKVPIYLPLETVEKLIPGEAILTRLGINLEDDARFDAVVPEIRESDPFAGM
jgi:hypothetical protein